MRSGPWVRMVARSAWPLPEPLSAARAPFQRGPRNRARRAGFPQTGRRRPDVSARPCRQSAPSVACASATPCPAARASQRTPSDRLAGTPTPSKIGHGDAVFGFGQRARGPGKQGKALAKTLGFGQLDRPAQCGGGRQRTDQAIDESHFLRQGSRIASSATGRTTPSMYCSTVRLPTLMSAETAFPARD